MNVETAQKELKLFFSLVTILTLIIKKHSLFRKVVIWNWNNLFKINFHQHLARINYQVVVGWG